ncbi:unnamed protein product [Bathycoccus prasinos]
MVQRVSLFITAILFTACSSRGGHKDIYISTTSISRRLFPNYFYVHTHNFPSSKPAKSKLPTSHTEVILKLENALSECKTWSPVCLASTTRTKPLAVARKIHFSSEDKEKEVMASFRETSREEMRAPLVE